MPRIPILLRGCDHVYPTGQADDSPGLLFREFAAVHIMAGLLINYHTHSHEALRQAAEDAVAAADELIAALNRPARKQPGKPAEAPPF